MENKKCIICNKTHNYKYQLFGRGCLENMYNLLEIGKPSRFIWNKETYLCTKIAWKNHKYFLNKSKKYNLAQKYIALKYLDKMDYELLNDTKNKILKDINNISIFSRNITENISFSLNEIYKLYNYSKKFNEIIEEIKEMNWETIDEETAKNVIKSLNFIFDKTKKDNPISYAVFYSMQYIFWQIVVVGGIFAKMKFSARLLEHALPLFGKEPKDLVIEDDETIKLIIDNKKFQERISNLIKKYGGDNDSFSVDISVPQEDVIIRFDGKDLLFALHDATMLVEAQKNENGKWNFEIEINDTYDFTDFKNLREYADTDKSKFEDILSTTLNNFGVISSEYGVIKTYDLKIKFKTNEDEIKKLWDGVSDEKK